MILMNLLSKHNFNILKELENTKKKVELIENLYPKNEIWLEVNSKLESIIQLIKKDKRIYRW